MAAPYIPASPIEAPALPPPSVHLVMMEAWLERQIMAEKPKRRSRMVLDLYGMAADLEALGNVSRIRSANREAERNIAQVRREAAATFRAYADLFSRLLLERC